MLARVVALAAATLCITASAASAETALNVIPHGQQAPLAPWASTPGMLPADAQAKMYDRITPLWRNIGADVLNPSADGTGYFKSSKLLNSDDPSLITDQTVSGTSPTAGPVSARIRRDAYGVPFVFSDTDAGAIFGAGYVVATDQALLIGFARTNGIAALVDLPGASAIKLVLETYNFVPSDSIVKEVTDLQTKSILAKGEPGKKLLNDIDTYLAGANVRMAETGGKPLTRTDIYAANAIKGQFLGEGGGQEIQNALALADWRKQLGNKTGTAAWNDLRAANDPEAATTTSKSASWQGVVPAGKGKGEVDFKAGSFKSSGVKLPGAASAAALPRERQKASNILIVSGKRSATGAPLFVGGPQIGFNYPGLTMEMQLKSPSINVRGATSAPYPGYMLIGRGADFAWTLTSAGADIIDTYALKLCGGSKTKYVYKGKCLSMKKVNAGVIEKGGKKVDAIFWRTVYGPVQGYAKDAKTGKQIALATKRSSYGRDTTDLLFNQRITYGQVKTAKDFVDAAKQTPQTFNSFYANKTESAFYTSGAMPLRPKGVTGDLPVDGSSGKYGWKGELASSKHPQVINPSTGLIINWNNKPAKNFPAGDDRFGSEGGLQRTQMLEKEVARNQKLSLTDVISAENAGATGDVRAITFWPTLKRMLDKGKSPSAVATSAYQALDAWNKKGGSRVDANLDGNVDDPGAAILDAAWQDITTAGLCGRLTAKGCKTLETRISRYEPSGQYSGWHQYMDKDFRRLLGKPVKGKYTLKYCKGGTVKTCSAAMWKAINTAAKDLANKQGSDVTKWQVKARTITFSPVPLVTMSYSNKPTGIQQVMTFN